MIDIVIPYRLSLYTNSLELKYCLRSIEKHVKDAGRIWIIGQLPDYIDPNTVGYIPVVETNWYEYLTRNIHNKLMVACGKVAVSDPFLYMNDDHFILQDIEAELIPPYHGGKDWKGTGKYQLTINNTLNKYPNTDNYDIHTPMLIYKKDYTKAVGLLNWKMPFGFCIKTMYTNATDLMYGRYYPDYKLDTKPTYQDFQDIIKRQFFSVGDKAFTRDMVQFLNTLFPIKSKYEV